MRKEILVELPEKFGIGKSPVALFRRKTEASDKAIQGVAFEAGIKLPGKFNSAEIFSLVSDLFRAEFPFNKAIIKTGVVGGKKTIF